MLEVSATHLEGIDLISTADSPKKMLNQGHTGANVGWLWICMPVCVRTFQTDLVHRVGRHVMCYLPSMTHRSGHVMAVMTRT